MGIFKMKPGLLSKCCLPIITIGLLIGQHGCGAEEEVGGSRSDEPELQIKTSVGIGGSAASIILLAETIQRDKSSQRIRLNWNFTIAGQGGSSTALYDREKSTLKLYSTLEDTLGKSYKNYLYAKVTDATIVQLAEEYRSDDITITDLSFIDRLPYGKDLGQYICFLLTERNFA